MWLSGKMKYLLTCSLPLNSIWHDLRDFREPQKRNCTGSLVWKRLQENVWRLGAPSVPIEADWLQIEEMHHQWYLGCPSKGQCKDMSKDPSTNDKVPKREIYGSASIVIKI